MREQVAVADPALTFALDQNRRASSIIYNVDEVCFPLGHSNSCGLLSSLQSAGGNFCSDANAITKIFDSITMRLHSKVKVALAQRNGPHRNRVEESGAL